MTAAGGLPEDRPLIGWYGDDFTGAATVMDVLNFGGVKAVLFFGPPTPERLRRFPDARAIGIAGIARSQGTAWMDRNLPAYFKCLAELNPVIVQYKICSTFDSSPQIGSIGRAFEIGDSIFRTDWVPLVVASPPDRRFQAFGTLFAVEGESIHRLDRHPTMSRHPATPMQEADVRLHLERQMSQPVGLVDLATLKRGKGAGAIEVACKAGTRLIALDLIDDETLRLVGELIWGRRGTKQFVVGSQGVEYALLAFWRSMNLLDAAKELPQPTPVQHMAAVSGSCSPLTARQIKHAFDRGFAGVRIDASKAVDERAWSECIADAVAGALKCLSEGRDPIVYTSNGLDGDGGTTLAEAVEVSGADATEVNARIGAGLGSILTQILEKAALKRGAIAGGDTSSHAAPALGAFAISTIAQLGHGVALYGAHFDDPHRRGVEIALKGGQMGDLDYFTRIRDGAGAKA